MMFFEFQMLDNKSIVNQVDELLLLVSRLKDRSIEVLDQLQVGLVIVKITIERNYCTLLKIAQ